MSFLFPLFGLSFTTENVSLTGIIIFITVAASLYADQSPEVKSKWVFNPYMVKNRKEYYRFLSSGFIHDGYMHLLFNMITFYYFGSLVEQIFNYIFPAWGGIIFVLFYLSAIIVSELPTYFKYLNNPARLINSLGASGGVSAILLAGILFNPSMKVGFFFIPIAIPGFIFAILYLFYSAYMGKEGGGRINHDAHLYGALYGIVFSILSYPSVIQGFLEYLMAGEFF